MSNNPEAVTGSLDGKGKRGFIFRIINANGKYNTADPLDGKTYLEGFPTWPTIHLEDWKPISGENAWVVMSSLQLYYAKYPGADAKQYSINKNPTEEMELAEELARAAMLLQADNGGIRMAPIGTYHEQGNEFYYNEISTENNLSWYAAFRMLYQVTDKPKYKQAMENIEGTKSVWDSRSNTFYQGAHYINGQWIPNDSNFAVDLDMGNRCFRAEK